MQRRTAIALGVGLAAMLGLALPGCGAGPSASSATPPAAATVTVTLAGGTATPHGDRIDLVRNQHLLLTVTSDRDDQVHVHGFDLEIPVSSGETVTKDIVMDKVGRFEVESHSPVLTLLVLQVQ